MSYAFRFYAVSPDHLDAAIGSEHAERADQLCARFAAHCAQHDEHFEDEIADGAPSLERALRSWVMRPPSRDTPDGWVYGYAFERLCEAVGRPVFVSGMSGVNASFLECVDETLDQLEAPKPARIEGLYGPAPVPMPAISDFPCVGFWSSETAAAFRVWLNGIDLDDVEDDGIATVIEALGDAAAGLKAEERLVAVYS